MSESDVLIVEIAGDHGLGEAVAYSNVESVGKALLQPGLNTVVVGCSVCDDAIERRVLPAGQQ